MYLVQYITSVSTCHHPAPTPGGLKKRVRMCNQLIEHNNEEWCIKHVERYSCNKVFLRPAIILKV